MLTDALSKATKMASPIVLKRLLLSVAVSVGLLRQFTCGWENFKQECHFDMTHRVKLDGVLQKRNAISTHFSKTGMTLIPRACNLLS